MQKHHVAKRIEVVATNGLLISLLLGMLIVVSVPTMLYAQGPALTTISDTVYRADGTPASGMVLISWPSFQTAEGDAVAAGNLSATIGTGGAFTAQLVPNVGASPAGTLYAVVYQLDDGTVRTEYWSVPTTSPTTIAGVRTTPGTGLGNTAATQQYVNAAVANRALDSAVVHLAGTETITGTKQFAAPPSLPTPVGANDAAPKGYVDAAVQNVGTGSYVLKTGDTMTGPLTLPGDPTAPLQAADRNYVDNGLAAKADLLSGLVPTAELGSGVASAATCLTGNSTWGACGGGAPAGITYATTALNWSQPISAALTGGSPAIVTLTPCPAGIDTTSGAGYQVALSGGGNSEAVNVATAPGGCTPGAPSGTIQFTPFFSYPAGSTIGSASSGIQETLNAACGVSATAWQNSQCNVTIPANGANSSVNTYNILGTIYFHSNQSVLSGYGTTLSCKGRGPCLQIGDLTSSNDFMSNTVQGLSFRSPTYLGSSPAFSGVAITQTQRASQLVTITTASPHGFRVGDMVTILYTDANAYWGDAIITAVPNATSFQYAHSGPDIAAQTTPGVAALTYVAVLDNSTNTHWNDVSYDKVGENGSFNNFFDLWDDENTTIDHFNATTNLTGNANWTGSFVFSAGNQGALQQIAPVITLRDSSITAINPGVTVYNSNGIYIENTVIQASGPWQVYSSNSTGNYQGAYIKNLYSESSNGANPLSSPHSPFGGTGVAGLIAGASTSAASFLIKGSGGTQGWFAMGGSGSVPYAYFVVAKDTTAGTQTSPMQVLNYNSTGNDTIAVRWPRVANGADVITYDLLRTATPAGPTSVYPYSGGCGGGSTTTCGSVATNIVQCAGLVCTYSDNGAAVTASYNILQGNYAGNLIFWPGSIVTVNRTILVDVEEGNVVGVGLSSNPAQIADQCTSYGTTSPGGYTVCPGSVTSSNNAVPNQTATLLTDGGAAGGGQSLSKGRLNFSTSPWANLQPHHIITLVDSQPALTRSTWGYRPAGSASDTWIGTDVPPNGVGLNQGQLAFGAPVSITNYIGATGDGTHSNWLERLSAAVKEFNVPVKFDQTVTIVGLSNGCLNVASGVIGSTGSPCGSGSGGGGAVSSVFGRTGAVTAQTGDYSASQVTGAAADAAVVHNSGNESISGTKTFVNNVTVSGNLVLPQASGYVPGVGGVGIDTQAGLPVVNIGGTTEQMALTSSNISGQAGTALALAQTPTQCSGSFATGIQANGNANCTTPDVIQLAETTAPAGIPNWGVFWFDAATHSPKVIDNNGQVIQLGLTDLFNSDPNGDPADNLEERNGGTPQNLRVYSNYVSNSTWTRMSLGYDAASGYQVLRSEDATSGNALGLGMYIGSNLKWAFAANGGLKPNVDNLYDMGTDSGQAMRSVFAKTSFNMYSTGRQDFEFPNDGTNGTTLNQLAVYNSGATGVQTAGMTNTDGVVGIVSGGAGTSKNAVITWAGIASCNFDAATPAAGDYVVASTTQAGKCHDTGSGTRPVGVQVIGRIENGEVRVSLGPPSGGGGGGAVSSVFGRTGAVTAASGDYSVSQVTGAAPLASPTFTGVITGPDGTMVSASGWAGSPTFLNNVTINGNLNVAGTINQTSNSPTQWSGKEWTGTTTTVPPGMDFSLGVGSDATFHCQLASGASCMPSSSGAVASVFGRTGAVTAQSGDYTASQVGLGNVTNNAQTQAAIVPNTAPGAGQILVGTSGGTAYAPQSVGGDCSLAATGAVTCTKTNGAAFAASATTNTTNASNITSGTLPHAQLPGLVSGDIPNNAANTSGTAAGLSGTPALPNGTTATTQSAGDNSGKLATTAYVDAGRTAPLATSFWSTGSASVSFNSVAGKAQLWGFTVPYPITTTKVMVGVVAADTGSCTYDIGILNGSGNIVVHLGNSSATALGFNSTGTKNLTWTTSGTAGPGKYYIAITASATTGCATLGASTVPTFISNAPESVNLGGTLNNGITIPADSPSFANVPTLYIQ